jgi:uncharacterized coiled-coil DUF342 family protein
VSQAGEQWYLITEPELRSIEEYRRNSEAERRNWLLQVSELRTRAEKLNGRAESLRAELSGLNGQLRIQRELNRNLTLSFNGYEAETLTRLSLKDGEITELRERNKAVAGQRNAAVIAAAALALAWAACIAFKVLRFLKIIPV